MIDGPFRRDPRDEIRRELEAHVEERIEELTRQGLDPDTATQRARREFGDASDAEKEMTALARRTIVLSSLRRTLEGARSDVRYAVRSLVRHPGFSVVAVLATAAGIGASTTVFSVADGVLLRPLAYHDPDAVVTLWATSPQGDQNGSPSYPDFEDWRARSQSFSAMAFIRGGALTHVSESDGAALIRTALVTPDFVAAVAPPTFLGSLASLADPSETEPVVALKYATWRTRFSGDSTVVGRVEPFSDGGYRVVAILAPDVDYPLWAEGYARLTPDRVTTLGLDVRPYRLDNRVVARLADGVTVEQARSEIQTVAARLAEEYPASNGRWGADLEPLKQTLVGQVATSIWLLLASVVALLLIACGNVASLSLARTLDRAKELGLRACLGAARGRLTAMLWVESLVVAAAGGVLGVLAARWGVRAFLAVGLPGLPRTGEITVDARVMLVAAATSAGAGMLLGLAPVLLASRIDLMSVLRGGTPARRSELFRSALVSGQVAITVTLLAATGLLLRSFLETQRVDTGFDPAGMTTLRINPPASYQGRPDLRDALYSRILATARSRPGIAEATIVNHAPLSGTGVITPLLVEGLEPDATPPAWLRTAGPDFFEVLGIRMVAGRAFESSDHDNWSGALVVSQVLAQQLWGDTDPLGRRLTAYRQVSADTDYGEPIDGFVVGVAANTRTSLRAGGPTPAVYVPMSTHPWPTGYLIARPRAGASIVEDIRQTILDVEPQIPVTDIVPYAELARVSVDRDRFLTILSTVSSALAVFLALTGTYGVLSYAVRRRSREIAIQVALGSGRGRVSRQVFRRATILVGSGVVAGVAGAGVLTRFMGSVLYQVDPLDPLAFGGSVAIVGLLGLVGGWIPARRAARVDPMTILRE